MMDHVLPLGVAVVIASSVIMHVTMVYQQNEATSIFDVLSPSKFSPLSVDNSVEEYVLRDTLSKPLILSGNNLRVTYGTDMRTRILRFQGVTMAHTDIFVSTQDEELFTVAFPDRLIKASDCTLMDARTVTSTSVEVEFDCPLGTAGAASPRDASQPPVFSLLWHASLIVLDYAEVLKIDIEFLRDSYASVVGADVTLFRLLMTEETNKSGGIGEQAQMPGIPLRGKQWWASVEHPRAVNFRSLSQGVMTGSLVLSSKEMRLTASFGVSLAPSLEIAFAQYVESFRPLKEPFLFYNSAYDVMTCAGESCAPDRAPTKKNVEQLVKAAGKHGVLLNDGWDKTEGVPWVPSFDLPAKTTNESARGGVGLWLSPTGGYRKTAHLAENSPFTRRNQRIYEAILENAQDSKSDVTKENVGTTTVRLSHPQYYAWLKKRLTTLKDDYGASFFAMDKIDTLYKPEELDALLVLVKDLPFVLLMTEDLWASPWFLVFFHAVWRGGTDLGEAPNAASSSARLKMRTFRDMNIFKVHERSNGLFPLRRLVNNGVIWSSFAEGAQLPLNDTAVSFAEEVDYYFAEGQLVKQVLVDTRALSPKDTACLQTRWDNAVPALRSFRHVQHIGADPSVSAYGLISLDAHAKNGTFRIRNPMRTEVTVTISRQFLSLPLQWEYDVREIGGESDILAGRIPMQVALHAEQVRSFDLLYVSGASTAGGDAEGPRLL